MQAASPSAASAVTGAKAGFWIRLVAILIDSILIAIVNTAIAAVFSLSNTGRSGLQTLLGIIYYVYFWSSASMWPGQTLGNKLLNIRVVRTDGSDLSIGQGIIRYIGLLISCLAIFIGVIWAAFDPNKQGWHDKIADTYVVKTTA